MFSRCFYFAITGYLLYFIHFVQSGHFNYETTSSNQKHTYLIEWLLTIILNGDGLFPNLTILEGNYGLKKYGNVHVFYLHGRFMTNTVINSYLFPVYL